MVNNNKFTITGSNLQPVIESAVSELTACVKATLGPGGRNVVLANKPTPTITKDGVSVARAMTHSDPGINAIMELIKDVSIQAETTAGDGTTTATVLMEAMLKYGMSIREDEGPRTIIKRLTDLVSKANTVLDKMSKDVSSLKDLNSIARVSANGDLEMASMVAEAIHSTGELGIVSLKDGDLEDKLTISDGYVISRGYLAPVFCNKQDTYEEKDNRILVLSGELDTINKLTNLQKILNSTLLHSKNITLMVNDVSPELMGHLVNLARTSDVLASVVKNPSHGTTQLNILKDIAFIGDGRVLEESLLSDEYLTNNRLDVDDYLCDFNSIVVSSDTTILTFNKSTRVHCYMENLVNEFKEMPEGFLKGRTKERIARIDGSIATINVGGVTKTDMQERKERFDDSLRATKAAFIHGSVIGGGHALLNAMSTIEVTGMDFEDISSILSAPYRQILRNSFYTEDQIHQSIIEYIGADANMCLDVIKDIVIPEQEYVIVDPVFVTKTALTTALSIAKLLTTTDSIILGDNKIPTML